MPVEPLRPDDSTRPWITARLSAPIRSACAVWPAILARSPVGGGATAIACAAGSSAVGFHSRARLESVLPIDHDLIPLRNPAAD